jgi:hypothetical protein
MGFNLVTEKLDLDGDPPKLEVMARRWSKRIEVDEQERESFRRTWYKYQNAFFLAVDHLHNKFPVYDESYLPSANMLATLSVFFFHNAGQPNRHQALEIRKWFWATGVAQRYSGRGYHRNIVSDARLFTNLALGRRAHFTFRDRLDPVLDIQSAEYTSRSTRTRAFFCLLASRNPEYLEKGGPIPLRFGSISHANRKDRHHLFPQAQLRKHFSARVYNSLCNICFLVSRDNTKIGKKLPRRYLATAREAGPREFHRVMRSHLIPVGNDSGIWEKGVVRAFKDFRQQRLKVICSEFEKEARIKLFRTT